jgi:hypothetical protein
MFPKSSSEVCYRGQEVESRTGSAIPKSSDSDIMFTVIRKRDQQIRISHD